MKRKPLELLLPLVFMACGSSGSLEFSTVAGIPPGNGAGTQLSGTFTTLFEATSDGCSQFATLEVPGPGETESIELEVTHQDGTIRFKKLQADLRGSASFENRFEVGGAEVTDVGGQSSNFLVLVRVQGEFRDANQFSGSGEERMVGRVGDQEFDCSFSFNVSGIRKE